MIVRFDEGGWAAYFCTDAEVSVRDILETVAARWAVDVDHAIVKQGCRDSTANEMSGRLEFLKRSRDGQLGSWNE